MPLSRGFGAVPEGSAPAEENPTLRAGHLTLSVPGANRFEHRRVLSPSGLRNQKVSRFDLKSRPPSVGNCSCRPLNVLQEWKHLNILIRNRAIDTSGSALYTRLKTREHLEALQLASSLPIPLSTLLAKIGAPPEHFTREPQLAQLSQEKIGAPYFPRIRELGWLLIIPQRRNKTDMP